MLTSAFSPADTGDETLIEYSLDKQNGIYYPDIDVSFVYVEHVRLFPSVKC